MLSVFHPPSQGHFFNKRTADKRLFWCGLAKKQSSPGDEDDRILLFIFYLNLQRHILRSCHRASWNYDLLHRWTDELFYRKQCVNICCMGYVRDKKNINVNIQVQCCFSLKSDYSVKNRRIKDIIIDLFEDSICFFIPEILWRHRRSFNQK